MPSATGQNWEKYQRNYADDEIEEKKITPLSDEYGTSSSSTHAAQPLIATQGYPSAEDIWSCTVRRGAEEAREGDQGQAAKRE